jgi:integrase/recombinase XerD
MVRPPSGARYWTVLDEDLAVVPAADSFLRQLRFGRDGAESTTRAYAGGIALFLRWCARTGRDWQAGVEQLGLFMTWLVHAGPAVSAVDPQPGAALLAGPGVRPARSARRVNAVLAAVRGMVVHAVAEGTAPGRLVQVCTRSPTTRIRPAWPVRRRAGRAGGCGHGTSCTSRTRRWTGPVTRTWSRYSGDAVRRGIG